MFLEKFFEIFGSDSGVNGIIDLDGNTDTVAVSIAEVAA